MKLWKLNAIVIIFCLINSNMVKCQGKYPQTNKTQLSIPKNINFLLNFLQLLIFQTWKMTLMTFPLAY